MNSNLYFFIAVASQAIQPQFFIAQLHFKSPLVTWRLSSFSPVFLHLIEIGLPFDKVIRACKGQSHLQGEDSTLKYLLYQLF